MSLSLLFPLSPQTSNAKSSLVAPVCVRTRATLTPTCTPIQGMCWASPGDNPAQAWAGPGYSCSPQSAWLEAGSLLPLKPPPTRTLAFSWASGHWSLCWVWAAHDFSITTGWEGGSTLGPSRTPFSAQHSCCGSTTVEGRGPGLGTPPRVREGRWASAGPTRSA